jgi:hypothetical protein
MKTRFLFLFLSFLFLSHPSFGQGYATSPSIPGIYSECDFCQCSMGISPLLAMGGSYIRYDARYTELGTIYSDGVAQPNPTDHVQRFLTQVLTFNYQIVPNLSATLALPFARKWETSDDPTDLLGPNANPSPSATLPNEITNFGLADISLRLNYYLIADHSIESDGSMSMRALAMTAGMKFATANNNFTDDGQPADPDLELSTGTNDFIFGLGYMQGFGDWTLGADGMFNLRGPGAGYEGHVYGNNFNYDVTGRYRLYQNDNAQPSSMLSSAFASLGIRGEWRGYEVQDGQPLDSDSTEWTGGNIVYIAPGAQVYFTPRLSLDATVWIPIIAALNGDQLGETVRAILGIQFGL